MKKRIGSNELFLFVFVLPSMVAVLACDLYAQASGSDTQIYRVNRPSQWQQWAFPAGTIEFAANGSVTPVKFRGPHNAALDVGEFTHELAGGKEVRGGAWKAGSNLATANRIIDGDADTFWRPDPDAPLEDWWIEIDLGRAVAPREPGGAGSDNLGAGGELPISIDWDAPASGPRHTNELATADRTAPISRDAAVLERSDAQTLSDDRTPVLERLPWNDWSPPAAVLARPEQAPQTPVTDNDK